MQATETKYIPLDWTMVERGMYAATDQLGGRWFITQMGVSKWEVYRDGELVYTDASLRDAQRYGVPGEIKDRLDPQRRIRREERRAARRKARI